MFSSDLMIEGMIWNNDANAFKHMRNPMHNTTWNLSFCQRFLCMIILFFSANKFLNMLDFEGLEDNFIK